MSRSLKFICDTNVWYYAVKDHGIVAEITKYGGQPCVPFSTSLEILSGITEISYEERKAVCQSILRIRPFCLPDNEYYVSGESAWPNWSVSFAAVAESRSFADWCTHHGDQALRLRIQREEKEQERIAWIGQVVAIMASRLGEHLPQYSAWISGVTHLRPKGTLSRQVFDEDWDLTRIQRSIVQPSRFEKSRMRSREWLDCYLAVFKEYLFDLISKPKKPDRNDLFDLELFMYAIDDWHIVVSHERKGVWVDLATRAGYAQRVSAAGLSKSLS